jgi:predicted transcriptional regulator of viral defense system
LEADYLSTTEILLALLDEHGGYFTAKDARENGIDNKTLQRTVKRGLIERVAHGLYVGSDILPDPFFVAQYRCPKGIFSHETALFLHDLCDRVPLRLAMTIPSGWNSQSGRRPLISWAADLPHHRTYGSVYGGSIT